MRITVNTDASYTSRYKRGAYAFWITSNTGRIKKHGMLRYKMDSAIIAEAQCIYNAIYTISKDGKMKSMVKNIQINTDCVAAMYILQDNKKKIRKFKLDTPQHKHVTKMFTDICRKHFRDVSIEFRHVKSHVSTDSPREYVNDWCDKQAKSHINNFLKTKGHVNGYTSNHSSSITRVSRERTTSTTKKPQVQNKNK